MASPTFDFGDQLSEDWISQPRSSDGVASPAQSNPRSNALHSRIPLPTKPAISSKPVSAAQTPNRPSPRALHVKSKSELNIPILRNPDAKTNGRSRRPPSAARSVSSQHRRSSSAQSWTMDGTIQHNGPEARHGAASGQMTPEWRRRLLKGQEPAEQKDLFSPMGLENVFRPPSAQKQSSTALSPRRRNPGRPPADSSSIYPSSPPPYPSTRRRRATTQSTSPSPFRERPEHDHNQCLAKGGKCEGALRTPTPTRRQMRVKMPREDSHGSARSLNAGMKRVQSGASLAEHESISPVNIRNGAIDYKSVKKSVLHYHLKMEELNIAEQERPSSRSSENGTDYGATQRREALVPQVTITSLLDSSILGTDPTVNKHAYIGIKRGGYSSDDNFLRRDLSPSSFQPAQAFLAERSARSANRVYRPTTPQRDNRFTQSSPEKPRSGGSPLKLFGQHDTFTHNHLMRRLSQYVDYEPQSPRSQNPGSQSMAGSPDGAGGFGHGGLDDYEFPPGDSFLAKSIDHEDPSLPPVLPPSDPVLFEVPHTMGTKAKRRISRNAGKRVSNTFPSQRGMRRPSLAEFRRSIGDAADITNDGKRVLYSPAKKDHQSKRRRTLKSSVASPEGSPEPPSVGLLIGKKRTDALPGEEARNASPEVMAHREVLRPRSVTSSTTRRNSTSTMSSWLGAGPSRKVSENIEPSETMDASTKMLAEDIANIAVNVAQSMANGERKASVTTGDFFKEAKMIMKRLRGQPLSSGGPTPTRRSPSARASGDVSIVDQMSDIEELDEESIRSLRSLQKQRSIRSNLESVLKALDPHARAQERRMSQLSKFREDDEFGLALASSIQNLKIAPDVIPDDEGIPETDAPHIRILNRTTEGIKQADGEVHTSVQTRSSTDVSINRSIRTGGSSNSSRKYNIAPDTVKNLLSDHVGRMVFDHDKGIWVRNRSGSVEDRPGSSNMHSDGTEEDPLKSIPDLEDDLPSLSTAIPPAIPKRVSSTGTVINRTSEGATSKQPPAHGSSQATRPSSGHGADSSELSRFSRFGSSQAAPETRATSWSTAPPMKAQTAAVQPELTQVQEVGEPAEDQIGEQAILEPMDYDIDEPAKAKENATPRANAVAYSSPLSQLPDHVLFPSSCKSRKSDIRDFADFSCLSVDQTPVRRTRVTSALLRSKEKARNHLSAVKQRYSDRPVSRIDEQDEQVDRDLPSRHSRDAMLTLITPKNLQRRSPDMAVAPPSTGRHGSVAFHQSLLQLDPLSEFTIHQADDSLSLDIDYIKQRNGLTTRAEIDSRFQLAVRDLVARITDVEPYEPYWEYIRKLDLSNKKILTLHSLDNFCERIEELDVSNNELGQANGAPGTLFALDISNNCLTGMTAWGHLQNLHYLDVSNNQIDSLTAFAALPHLRELRADGNQITSLRGLRDCPGLQKLSLRGNMITAADLGECDLPHLTELDLSNNDISSLTGLSQLGSLQVLRIAGNKIRTLACEDLPTSLTTIDIAVNELGVLDISHLSHLSVLDVDGNRLAHITGLGEAQSLQTLSWRDQRVEGVLTINFQDACDVRHLALSGNRVDMSMLKARFLNLNTLELASCGIEALPSRFGRLMPNLRWLNLNHNAIKDIKPLIGIKRLHELSLVENRIHRLRNTAAVLEKLGHELTTVDLRVNPITLGFYPVPPTPVNTVRAPPKAALITKPTAPDSATSHKLLLPQEGPLVAKQVLENQDRQRDTTYRARLDEGTSLRRRVFELLLCHGCPAIEMINGLAVDTDVIAGKDEAWARLVELGIVRPKDGEDEGKRITFEAEASKVRDTANTG